MTPTAAAVRGSLCLTLLVVVLSWQAAAYNIENTLTSSPKYEEVTTSLAVNQLAILKLMHDSSTASCDVTEGLRVQVDRVLAALEVEQRQHMQQILGAFNTTALYTLNKVEQLREEMKEELANIVPEAQSTPASQATQQPTAATVPEVAYLGPIVHNDTLPSLCGGDKFLNGTTGALEVMKSGSYSSGVRCSWSLRFPEGYSVNLSWDYIDLEDSSSCSYDWVEVLDVTHSRLVYGRKLCGSLSSSILKLLNVRLEGTRNLLVSFRSDGSQEKRGFRMMYYYAQ